MLHVETAGTGAPGVLVHGFTQTLRSWDPVASHLSVYRRVVRVDLPGHGDSGAVRVRDIGEAAGALGDACGEATYVGYSLGGRVCMRLALDRPELVRALVLVSSSPGIEDEAERAERRRADEALASRIEAAGVDAFLDEWLAQPMFAGVLASSRQDRLRNTPGGLASALRALGQGAVEPMWDALAELRMPVGFIVGERDAKYRDVAKRMRGRIPSQPRVAVVPGAGHAPHLEEPDLFAGALERFLVRHSVSS